MKDSQMYFALCAEGLLWILGDHGDYEAADETAKSLGLNVVWILDEESAKQFKSILNSNNAGLN